MLAFVAELSELEHPEEFRAGILPGLRRLVPCELVTYNEVEFDAGRMSAAEDPAGTMPADAPGVFVRLGHQNALAERFRRTRDGRAYRWSDFITRRKLHATDLYRELYHPMGIEYQMAFCLPTPPEVIIGIAFNRASRDFDERERRLLNLVRSPLIRAYRMVERYAMVAARLAAAERGLEREGAAVIVLEPDPRGGPGRRAKALSDSAAALVGMSSGSRRLPEPVVRWLGVAREGHSPEPLLLPRADGGRVALRFLPARTEREVDAILVEPVGEPLSVASLRAAGLTPRQAEVLRLVAFGRTNAEIGAALRLSPRTVQKHLQLAFERLGVTSRTQAVATAWSIDRGVPLAARE
jgi:DNA-binding CsgD family transcriptional regulator